MYYERNGKKMIKVRELKRGETLFRTVDKYCKDYGEFYSIPQNVYLNTIKTSLPTRIDYKKMEEELKKENNNIIKENNDKMIEEEKEKKRMKKIERSGSKLGGFLNRLFN